MDANRTTPVYELKDELARLCLPSASRDAGRKLAWTNSICILFLLVGIIGARRARIAIHPVPPIAEVIPAIIEPLALPPQETTEKKAQTEAAPDDTPRVAVAIPQVPSVSFSIPTIGALAVPTALAALPLRPLRAAAQIGSLNDTGAGGDRPEPPYPPIARAQGEQGTVVVLLGADAAGNLTSIQIKTPSGSSILDRSTLDFLKRHWHLPAGNGDRLFETSITYQLQMN